MLMGEKLKNFSSGLQVQAKETTESFLHSAFRFISTLIIGFVLALIVQELTQSGSLMLIFMISTFTFALYKALARMSFFQIFIFDLICVLIGTILRMYIFMAP